MSETALFSNAFFNSSLGHMIDGAVSRLVQDLVAPPPLPGQELKTAIEQFRAVRERTIAITADLTQAQADFSPGQKVWSIAQIVDHLILSEQLYRGQFRKLLEMAKEGKQTSYDLPLSELNPSVAFIPQDLLPLLTAPLNLINMFVPRAFRETMFRFPLIPATNPSASAPRPSRPVDEWRADLAATLPATEALFEGGIPARLNEVSMSHPMLGANNVVQIFRLLAAHEERHHGQIRALQQNPRYPAA